MQSNRENQQRVLNNQDDFIQAVMNAFPLQKDSGFDAIFPFCNEYGFAEILKILNKIDITKTEKTGVSLVFGESNFISLLPYLAKISDVLLLADINIKLHENTAFILECFQAAHTPDEFMELYISDKNPIKGQPHPFSSGSNAYSQRFSLPNIEENMEFQAKSVGKYYYLNNQENFDLCKAALTSIRILPIHLDVSSNEECKNLNDILQQHHAEFTFCNVTNIGEYVRDLKSNVESLLMGHENAFILFSSRYRWMKDQTLRTIPTIGLNHYLSYYNELDDGIGRYIGLDTYPKHMHDVKKILKNPAASTAFHINKPAKRKNDEKCYLAIFSCNQQQAKYIVDGKQDLHSLKAEDSKKISFAYDTESDLRRACADKNDYWIVTLYNNKEKINEVLSRGKYFNYSDNVFQKHIKLYSYLSEISSHDGNITIKKDPQWIPDKYQTCSDSTPTAMQNDLPQENDSEDRLAKRQRLISSTDTGSENTKNEMRANILFFSQNPHQIEQAKLSLAALIGVLQGNEEKVIELAKSHPEVFFIKSTAPDYAMDLQENQRIIEDWSPYQSMFGAGDFDMLKKVKPFLDVYLETLPDGQKLAYDQEQEKFPNGFDYPESTYDFGPLVQAITKDMLWNHTCAPSDETLAVLAAFRAHFKPGIVKTGHHFYFSDLVKALNVQLENWEAWNKNQMTFFSVYVLGFLERLLPASYMQRICKWWDDSYGKDYWQLPVKRSFQIYNIAGKHANIEVFPLDSDFTWRLGDEFFITGRFAYHDEFKGLNRKYELNDFLALCKTMLSMHSERLQELAHNSSRPSARY